MQIRLKVNPEAKHNTVREIRSGQFEVSVKSPAKLNLANKHALSLLAKHLNVSPQNLKIVSGRNSPQKLVHLRELLK